MNTPTPRTDTGLFTVKDTRMEIMRDNRQLVDAFLCRTLERELTAVTEQLENTKAELLKSCMRERLRNEDYKYQKERADNAGFMLIEANEQRDRLAQALENCREDPRQRNESRRSTPISKSISKQCVARSVEDSVAQNKTEACDMLWAALQFKKL